MRGLMGLGILAALLVQAGAAQGQEPGGESLRLVCSGTDAMMLMSPSPLPGGYNPNDMRMSEVRAAAQMSVAVENGRVRVRPPKGSAPLIFGKDSKDGWYDLTGVSIDRLTIKGRLKYNRIDRPKLDIDRRTGEATFGGFVGVCRVDSTAPEATKF